MGIYGVIQDMDKEFNSVSGSNPIIVNDLKCNTEQERAAFDALIMSKFSKDVLSNIPSCDCPENTKGRLHGKYYIGQKCTICGTVVTNHLDDPLISNLWLRCPEDITAFINPRIWMMLCDEFTKGKFNYIEWFTCNPYRAPVKTPPNIPLIESLNIPRGYNNFIKHFDQIMEVLFNLDNNKSKRNRQYVFKPVTHPLYQMIKDNRKLIFCQYLPLPNKSTIIAEETNIAVYMETNVMDIKDAALIITNIKKSVMDKNIRKSDDELQRLQERGDVEERSVSIRDKENRVVQAIKALCRYYTYFDYKIIRPKPGLVRKHILGCRDNFSSRNVIISNTGIHKYNELIMPWTTAIAKYKYHILNKLLKDARNFSPNELLQIHYESALVYKESIYKIIRELIQESPYGGIPELFHRNPTIVRASIQLMLTVDVFKDPRCMATAMPIDAVVGPNADKALIN